MIAARLVSDLNRYVAARTTEAINGSDQVYTQRLKVHWNFDASGTVKTVNRNEFYVGAAAHQFATPAAFGLPDGVGSVVPITTGSTYNDLLRNINWVQGND